MIIILFAASLQINWGCAAKEPAEDGADAIRHRGVVSEIAAVKKRSDKAPDFAWTDVSGNRITFDEFHGNVTLLNFWATWCGPCRHEIPDLEAIHKDYSDKGVKVIGVSVDRGPSVLDDVAEFAVKFKMSYPVVIDNGDLEQIFGNIRAIPTTFVINKEGKIVERLVGARSKDMFLESVLPHLN